jgi:tetratricopeptide (TPR) repeat protein
LEDVVRRLAVAALALFLASCAARVIPPPALALPPRHPDFLYPTVPDGTTPLQATRIERAWQYLQADNFGSAERELQAAVKQQPDFHPAEAVFGYIELARRDVKDAIMRFDRALQHAPAYVPALVGRGRALLELGRDDDALGSFERALAADPSLADDLQGRIEVLRFKGLQDSLTRAKAASDAGRLDEARAAYGQALAASPESAFLYRDLALVEQKANEPGLALENFRKALALDPSDARSQAQIGVILEGQGDTEGALDAYEKARAIDPAEVAPERLERLRDAAALAKMPEEYRAIPNSAAITRGEVASLLAVRLGSLLAQTRPRQVVVTDGRGHWAQQWIHPVVRAGVMDTQPNYTFQPNSRVRRGDLAQTVSRVLNLIAAHKPDVAKAWEGPRPKIADVPQGHLSYPAVSQVVAAGVMPLAETGGFQLLRPVSGAEAVEILNRLEALAKP